MTTRPPHTPPPSPDEPLGRAVATLRRLPDVPPGAVDRVIAVAVARNGMVGRRSAVATWLARAAVVALAAGLGAVTATYGFGRGKAESRVAAADPASPAAATAPGSAAASSPAAGAELRLAAEAADDRPVATAFVLARQGAQRVVVVGDFNGWDPAANPMTADAHGVWTTTVPLAPGRHAYAFVVDGTQWVADPRAPLVRDVDYGRDQSVVLVGHP